MGSGGADNVTLRLLELFDRDKYEISLALMKSEGELFLQIPNDIKVISLNKSSLYFTVLPLIRLYDSKKYDVVYSTSSGMSIPVLIAKWVAQRNEVITVVSERSSLERRRHSTGKNRLIFKLKSWLTRKADYVAVVSDALGKEVIKYTGINEAKVVRCYNPIVPENLVKLKSEVIGSEMFSSNKDKIVAIGRLEKVKNIGLLIDSFGDIENENAELHILGVGSQKEILQQKVNQSDLSNKVFFHSFQDNVFKFLSKASVFVLPSKFEGMPGALIQAMATGCACIASDCYTGPSELINHDKNGFLFPVDDKEKLTLYINDLLANKGKALKMGERAKESVANYAYSSAVNSYFSFL
jgi:glycosyltransferase involved in cell wall biosynthesis